MAVYLKNLSLRKEKALLLSVFYIDNGITSVMLSACISQAVPMRYSLNAIVI